MSKCLSKWRVRVSLIVLRVSLIVLLLNDASIDTVDDEVSFGFSPKTEFKSPLCVDIAIDTEAELLHVTATVLEIC